MSRWTVTLRRGRRRIFIRPISAEVWLWLLIDVERGGARIASGQAETEAEALAQADHAARHLRGLHHGFT
jgi:hypothetical protein